MTPRSDFIASPEGVLKDLRAKDLKAEVRELTRNIRGLRNLKEEIRTALLGQELYYGEKRGFVTEIDSKLYKSLEKFGESMCQKIACQLGLSLEINVYNASTFACDSLLRDYPFEVAKHGYVTRVETQKVSAEKRETDSYLEGDLKGYDRTRETEKYGSKILGPEALGVKGPRYHHYYSKSEGGMEVISKESKGLWWDKLLPALRKKLSVKIVKEFKRNFGVGPLQFVRTYVTRVEGAAMGSWTKLLGWEDFPRITLVVSKARDLVPLESSPRQLYEMPFSKAGSEQAWVYWGNVSTWLKKESVIYGVPPKGWGVLPKDYFESRYSTTLAEPKYERVRA